MTQKTRQITVYLQGPTLLGDESGVGNYEQTLSCIPGTVLCGAIAGQIFSADNEAFRRMFDTAEHPPRFGNAYPAWPETWSYPFPATARTCKQYPGYATAKQKRHGVFDILVKQALYELLSDPEFPYRERLLPTIGARRVALAKGYQPRCPCGQDEICNENVTPAPGCYVMHDGKPGPAPRLPISRATHVGINRARGVAEDALLFTLETIESAENPQFRGRLVYDDLYESDLERLIGLNGQTHRLRIGRGRSRGMGLVQIQIDVPPQSGEKKMEDRLCFLHREFGRVLREDYDQVAEFAPGRFFSLTLRAPAILTGPDALPSLWPDLSKTKLAAAWPLRAWARTTIVGGWDMAAGLPRRTRQAVEAGAVYLYFMPEVDLSQKALISALETLELEGIGEQRERGYGQLTACAPFHYAGWVNGKVIALQEPFPEEREANLIQRARTAIDNITIVDQEEKKLKASQVQLLLREAQAGYGVEHVLNWLRYQQTRVEAWKKTGLAQQIVQDVGALRHQARDELNQSGVKIDKESLNDRWADLVQRYLAYLLRRYQVVLKRKETGND
jgi:CRISPR-associated Csx10 family RAMP protein